MHGYLLPLLLLNTPLANIMISQIPVAVNRENGQPKHIVISELSN